MLNLSNLLGTQPAACPVSSQAARQTSESGQVDAAALVVPFSFAAEAQSFRDLADTYDTPYLTNGPVILRSRIDEIAPALPAFWPPCVRVFEAFNSQPDLAMQVVQKYTEVSDTKVLQKTDDFFKTRRPFNPSLQVKDDQLQGMLDFLAGSSIPAAKDAKPQQFYDNRFLANVPK